MKVIFLDIDGVLNTEVYITSFFDFCRIQEMSRDAAKKEAKHYLRDEFGQRFDPLAVRFLKRIIEETGAKIVLSSAWRMSGLERNRLMWEMRDLPGELIGSTPILNTQRGEEIHYWLSENDVERYCIIDDCSDMLQEQVPFFVQTDPMYGLTRSNSESVINILNVD
jgi:hypothetical protein